jgi:chromosome segregation ATPase
MQALVHQVLCVVAAGLIPLTAAAQLFKSEDTDARRGIIELRARIAEVEQAAQARYAEAMGAASQSGASARSQMAAQFKDLLAEEVRQFGSTVTALRRSFLDLNNQIEALRGEQAQLRGQVEESDRQNSRRQTDAQAVTAAAVKQTREQMSEEFKNLLGTEIEQFVSTMAALRRSFVEVSTALETMRSQQAQLLADQAELRTVVEKLQARLNDAPPTSSTPSSDPEGKPQPAPSSP